LEGRSWTVTTKQPVRIAQAIGSEAGKGRNKPHFKHAGLDIQVFGLAMSHLLHWVKITRTG